MAPQAGNPPGPIQNATPAITARAAEPKSPAAEVRPRLLDKVHGRYGNLTVAAVAPDLQHCGQP